MTGAGTGSALQQLSHTEHLGDNHIEGGKADLFPAQQPVPPLLQLPVSLERMKALVRTLQHPSVQGQQQQLQQGPAQQQDLASAATLDQAPSSSSSPTRCLCLCVCCTEWAPFCSAAAALDASFLRQAVMLRRTDSARGVRRCAAAFRLHSCSMSKYKSEVVGAGECWAVGMGV
eukprot:CAMPEP_0173191138 /NCGR_PEP_ID=MMETSP1141-20130122/12724_1 /TAXON_ID=483371 /ORGANISM="non described non described, Strain CCMP2298" /LENGTH=173 /DNA_ID=CAMNT_0014115305 /DNA_START=108 /DNA_END=631 /DNA_ORIENTATION=+